MRMVNLIVSAFLASAVAYGLLNDVPSGVVAFNSGMAVLNFGVAILPRDSR